MSDCPIHKASYHIGVFPFFFWIALTCSIFSCKGFKQDSGDEMPLLYPPPLTVKLNTDEGYVTNPVTGDSIEPIFDSKGDLLITGKPLPIEGRVIDPEIVARAYVHYEVEKNYMIPDFDPDTTEYRVIVSDCEALTDAGYETSSPYATVQVDTADDPCSKWFNKTIIEVTAEDGMTKKTYEIEFEYDDVAVDEHNNSTGLSLYPNPFHSLLTICMHNNQTMSKVEILSLDTRLVRIIDHVDLPSITLHRENLLPGLYFIRVHSDKTYVRKVMIR